VSIFSPLPALIVVLAIGAAGCAHPTGKKAGYIKSLSDADFSAWVAAKKGTHVCVRGELEVSIHAVAFRMDMSDNLIAPYSGMVSTSFSQRAAVEAGLESGAPATICGDLVEVQYPTSCEAIYCKNYLLRNSRIAG
jgi:hypothetical protein